MPRSPRQHPSRKQKAADSLGRAELAAEFLKRNRTYRAEHAQMRDRIARGTVAGEAAEAAFARRWGLSFRVRSG